MMKCGNGIMILGRSGNVTRLANNRMTELDYRAASIGWIVGRSNRNKQNNFKGKEQNLP